MKEILLVTLLSLLLPGISMASNSGHHKEQSAIAKLSPELRLLFSKEMIALKKGMNEIMSAYLVGNWKLISDVANKMERSYVLRQGLTRSQMHELHSTLPDEFLQLDEKFHYYSGMLGHAANIGKAELIGFYYSKMSETCVSCHRQYATHKFPLFIENTTNQHGGH